jgi:hypothetical protein
VASAVLQGALQQSKKPPSGGFFMADAEKAKRLKGKQTPQTPRTNSQA